MDNSESETDTGPIFWTQSDPIHLLNNATQPNPAFFEPTGPDPIQPKQAEQVQCNIIEQFYASNIQVTRRYSMHCVLILSNTELIISPKALRTLHNQTVILQPIWTRPDPIRQPSPWMDKTHVHGWLQQLESPLESPHLRSHVRQFHKYLFTL